ncbi:peptidoglycan-binding domain-containing protein [Streptomyces sp. DG2A-72]|uniref:peptidoglycan-binding protein n=1 Tax=Streptomyces sp. DG2A-72 TaxID=3051386 RepID=UPI00265C76D7|nr:peptidoglycan-binding domain-containing protein [Streptomyces sp. DG2A-72]MDO0938930.1 peptidoglycan-binding domain-containing protein [Streptomyces sp. DG2A-72]
MTAVERRHRRTRVLVGGTMAAATAAAAVAAALGFGGGESGATTPRRDMPAATAHVVRRTLTDATNLSGRLDYGATAPIVSRATGTVTWLPPVGSLVGRGGVLLRADDRPVPLLYGALPMYRALAEEAEGPDVLQFERNLRALGYTGFAVDEEFTKFTAAAVKRWQRDLGLPATGSVGVDQVIYGPGRVRIAQHSVRLGASADAQVLTCTSTTKVVTADVQTTDAGWAIKGTKVQVRLSSGASVAGTVAAVGDEGTAGLGESGESSSGTSGGQDSDGGSESQDDTVTVTIAITKQKALRGTGPGTVDIRYTAERRENVLAVPVVALLALAEGGYGLEVVKNSGADSGPRTRIVPVRTGLFAEGLVEVHGPGITAGATVGMPE